MFVSGQGLNEMSKERPGIKHIENHTNTFLKSLEKVEAGLSAKIQYLTQVSTGMFSFTIICEPILN